MAYLGNQPVVGDSANTFKLLDDISTFTLTFDGSSASVVSVANDTLTFANHRFVTGQRVTYGKGGGTVITGLTDATAYFIIKVDQSTIKLATNASNAASSTAIDLTGLGAGTSHTLNVAFDGVNTKFKATHTDGTKANVSRAAQLSLSINGVIQQPTETKPPTVGYGIEADSTIVFSTAPVSTDKAFGSFIGEVAPSFDLTDNTVDNFTGDGSTTSFTLSKEIASSQDVLVTLDGVTQYPSDTSTTRAYSVIGQTLTFVSAPADGVAIQARHIGFAGATSSEVTGFYGRTGNVALKSTDDITFQNASAGIITATTFGGNPSFTGSVSIGGTLTYEDVTNIDSVGLVTARNGIVVGSGITLSKDGDIFATGISTVKGIHVNGTALGENLKVGTGVTITRDGNGFFTGIITATTFSGVDTDKISEGNTEVETVDTGSDGHVKITIEGSEKVRVNSTGMGVGITPVKALNVVAGVGTTEAIRLSQPVDASVQQNFGIGWCSNNNHAHPGAQITSLEYDASDTRRSLLFYTRGTNQDIAPTERLRITSNGHVNIGNSLTQTSRLFTVENTLADGGEVAYIGNNDGSSNYGGLIISAGETDRECRLESAWGNGFMTFYTNNGSSSVERLRLTSGGRVLINSTAARNISTNINRMLQIESSGGGAGLAVARNSDNASGPSIDLGKSRGYPNTIVQSGDMLGQIRFAGADGTNLESPAAQIKVEVDGTPGENDMPGRIVFSTTADGAASPTEAMRITSAGYMTRPLHPNFCARYSSGESNSYSAQDVIKYTGVSANYRQWNIGGHYSTSTGKFTAPIDGIYRFEGQCMSTGWSNNDSTQDLIFLNSSNGNISFPRMRRSKFRTEDDDNGYFTNSVGGQANLSAGDTVWLQLDKGCSISNSDYSYFTGWLVQ